ncbi:hypothetical protein HZ326_10016 [Fusarium oxysporum f. sp. albedinis]|nr:hypothetical protein HZ326_10016 [Fusarium oxysporum f. sp. albedinis]
MVLRKQNDDGETKAIETLYGSISTDQPLGWYHTIRRQMKLDARVLSLQLSKLYGTLFPEDRRLTLNAHDAGVDVTMTIRLVKAYLLRAFGMPLPGKIDFHFSLAGCGAKGWELDVRKLLGLLEKATPAIALRKANDDEISQKDFSNDKPLEDILNDESAGDLFMRFEEKHTLDNSVDGSN